MWILPARLSCVSQITKRPTAGGCDPPSNDLCRLSGAEKKVTYPIKFREFVRIAAIAGALRVFDIQAALASTCEEGSMRPEPAHGVNA